MNPPRDPPAHRLRDEPGPEGLVLRAQGLIRAVPAPRPLSAHADARVLAALGRGPWSGFRPHRLLLPAAAVLVIVVSGFSAVAALEWIRLPRPVLAPQPAPPPVVAPQPRPTPPAAVAVVPPRPVVRLAALHRRHETAFTRAQLAIDPRAQGQRPQVPADFWRAHVGEHFTWKVKICVGRTGEVENVTLLSRRHPALDSEIVRALGKWRYHPAARDGKPVVSCSNLVYLLTVEPPGNP